MKIEVGKSYRRGDHARAIIAIVGPPTLLYPVVYDAGRGYYEFCTLGGKHNIVGLPDPRDFISEWSEPTPFEKYKIDCKPNQLTSDVAFRAGWNAALDYAAGRLDTIRIGGSLTGTVMERIKDNVADEIRKAKV